MSKHEKMILKKYAGTYQLRIETPEDLSQIAVLDEAHWVATSAPVEGINCDPVFLNFIDTDHNGRIRTDEVRAAQAWLFTILKNRGYLGQHVDTLKLDAIDTTHEAGKRLREVSEYVLESLSCEGDTQITLGQVRQAQNIINKSAQNGDGVIPPDAAREDEIAEFIADVIKLTGGTADVSGNKGITETQLEAFLNQAKAWLALLIGKQVERFKEKKIEKSTQEVSSGMFKDILLGGGIAIAALGTSFAFIVKTLASLKLHYILVMISLVAGAITIPSLLVAVVKLRRRNMSAILEASGWAVNTEMRLTSSLGYLFTRVPKLPEGAKKQRIDLVKKFARQQKIK